MSAGYFMRVLLLRSSVITAVCLYAILALSVLMLPTIVLGESSPADERPGVDCIDSFFRLMSEGEETYSLMSGKSTPLKHSSVKPALAAACADLLVEHLALYEEHYRVERGKPPPPPPPPADSGPAARAWHAFTGNGLTAFNASRLYLFGGSGNDRSALPGDLWYFLSNRSEWKLAPTGMTQPGRRQHVGFSCGGGQCVTSNGSNGVSWIKETWVYTEGTSSWSQVNCKRNLCPSARGMPAMAYDSARAYHILFGGLNGQEGFNDTYIFAGGRWNARNPVTKPAARDRAAAAFAGNLANGVVLFGGQQGEQRVLCDMYVWSGSNWREVTMGGNGPCLHSHSMAWDGERLIIAGGYVNTNDQASEDVWYFTFTGSASGLWTRAEESDPLAECAKSAEPGARMAYDIPSDAMVFFGGELNIDNVVVRFDTTVECPVPVY